MRRPPAIVRLSGRLGDVAGRTVRVQLGDLGGVPQAQVSRRLKSPLPEWAGPIEPVARTFRIRLIDPSSGLDPSSIREVRLVFDRTPSGLVHLDDVGIGSESLPPITISRPTVDEE